ncbi:hypothetical protein LINPERPRIM_LOCUS42964 [Linum perenne]
MKAPYLFLRISRAIRKLRKEAESTLLRAIRGFRVFVQAHSRDPHEAWAFPGPKARPGHS